MFCFGDQVLSPDSSLATDFVRAFVVSGTEKNFPALPFLSIKHYGREIRFVELAGKRGLVIERAVEDDHNKNTQAFLCSRLGLRGMRYFGRRQFAFNNSYNRKTTKGLT